MVDPLWVWKEGLVCRHVREGQCLKRLEKKNGSFRLALGKHAKELQMYYVAEVADTVAARAIL